jgi:hypothetical protein
MAKALAGKLPPGDIKGHLTAGSRDNVRSVGGQLQAGFFQQPAVFFMHVSILVGGRSGCHRKISRMINPDLPSRPILIIIKDQDQGLFFSSVDFSTTRDIPIPVSRPLNPFQHTAVSA